MLPNMGSWHLGDVAWHVPHEAVGLARDNQPLNDLTNEGGSMGPSCAPNFNSIPIDCWVGECVLWTTQREME